MNYSDFLELVENRRSIRKFKQQKVSREQVEKILDAARWAPSGANYQPWEFVVVDDEKLKAKISDILLPASNEFSGAELVRRAGFKGASVFIVVCGDYRIVPLLPSQNNIERGNETFTSDMANVFLILQLAVRSLGLGSQWVSSIVGNQHEVKSLLGIPDAYKIYDMAAIGYIDETPKNRSVRALKDLVHYNKFDSSRVKSEKDLATYVKDLRQSTR